MGRCEYVDDSASFLDGWHCRITGRHVETAQMVRDYCNDSINCENCPHRNPQAHRRDEEKVLNQQEEPEASLYYTEQHSQRETPERIPDTDHSSYVGGGSWSSYRGRRTKTIAVMAAVLFAAVLVFGGQLIGIWGPWVDMQLPEGASAAESALLIVGRGENNAPLFKTRAGSFDESGYAHVAAFNGTSDVYFRRDDACVWVGTTDLLMLNTSVVYDIGYDEIQDLLYRPLLLAVNDADGRAIPSALTVADEYGQPVRCIAMGDGKYVLLLNDDDVSVKLTFRAEGYPSVEGCVDLSDRLMSAVITLPHEGSDNR